MNFISQYKNSDFPICAFNYECKYDRKTTCCQACRFAKYVKCDLFTEPFRRTQPLLISKLKQWAELFKIQKVETQSIKQVNKQQLKFYKAQMVATFKEKINRDVEDLLANRSNLVNLEKGVALALLKEFGLRIGRNHKKTNACSNQIDSSTDDDDLDENNVNKLV